VIAPMLFDIPNDMRAAIVDAHSGLSISYKELIEVSDRVKVLISNPNEVTAIFVDRDFADVVLLAACLLAEVPIAIMPPDFGKDVNFVQFSLGVRNRISANLDTKSLHGINIQFHPMYLEVQEPAICNPLIKTLLFTSGSTGKPSAVALSAENIRTNASQIVNGAEISSGVVTLLTLSAAYSYGLSLVTTTLSAHGTLVVSQLSIIDRAFWDIVDEHKIQQFAGVPWTYQALRASRIDLGSFKSLSVVTQAGGFLDIETRKHFHNQLDNAQKRFLVMYGQTEASPRMAIMPHTELPYAWASAGYALPDSRFEIESNGVSLEGEIIFYGPNVALNVLNDRSDLLCGDVFQGRLGTGDIGTLTSEGLLTITGRTKRIAKINGRRISLDEVERAIGMFVACTSTSNSQGTEKIICFISAEQVVDKNNSINQVMQDFGLRGKDYEISQIETLPRLPNGKVDYSHLKRESVGKD
jgi:long-chain acyl-CoA synthetase